MALGIPFAVDPADVAEEIAPGESAESAASRLAADKAARVAERRPGSWILAADTLVLREGRILGKPRDDADAARMLRFLAGQEHRVVTAVRLTRGADRGREVVETTAVRIAPLSDEEILWYVATGEPRDKAGAYAVQGLGARFIESVNGSYTNVMGLPARAVYLLLNGSGDPALARLAGGRVG
jgi:septum formation protein